MRTFQYMPYFKNDNVIVHCEPLFEDASLSARYKAGSYSLLDLVKSYRRRIKVLMGRGRFDVLWIEKEALPWLPLWLEKFLLRGTPYVLDYDDAVFHKYDQHRIPFVRHLFGRRLDGLMSNASLVIGGNSYLAQRARDAGSPWVKVLPTVIDLNRYPFPMPGQEDASNDVPTVVWIGSPSTVRYLKILQSPLQALALRLPFVLRVIGGEIDLPGVKVQCVAWSEATEVENISVGHVGVMPLLDSPWERGKCGYKLIQYMACGLPVVASPVGVNAEIVEPGVNGYLASNEEEWLSALEGLLTQAHLRQSLGEAGRAKVEAQYCIQKTGPKMAWLLIKAANGG